MPISPNMGLNVPVVSTTPGPQYAQDVNASLNKVDTHNHTSGQGVQVPTAGLNINANLPMNTFGLSNASIIGLVSSALPATNGTLYRNTDDLYFKDGAGNNVRITQGGSVAVSGAIGFTGLPFGTAGASYNNLNQTFVFQSATNTAANVDCGSVTLREVVAAANGVTLASPLALAGDYTLRMPPALPINTEALLVSSTGSITAGGTANSLTATTITGTNTNVLNTLSVKNDTGLLQFRNTADAVQFASITGSSSGLTLNLPDTADSYTFQVNTVTKAVINNNGIDGQYIYYTNPTNSIAGIDYNRAYSYFAIGGFRTMASNTITISQPKILIISVGAGGGTGSGTGDYGFICNLNFRVRITITSGLNTYYEGWTTNAPGGYGGIPVGGLAPQVFISNTGTVPAGTYTINFDAATPPQDMFWGVTNLRIRVYSI